VTDQTLQDRHVLVTGAGTGIGAAIAVACAQSGARISLAGRRRDPLIALQASLGKDRAQVAADFDVTDEHKVHAGVAAARTVFGPIDILVNNAGEAPSAPLAKTDLATWNRVLAVNLTGTFLVTREVMPDMIAKRGGRIINIASTAGLTGYAYVSPYVSAKHGVIGLTRSLALEFVRSGVTVNAVCPGYTDTPMFERAVDNIVAKTKRSREDARSALATSNPQGRLVTPEEVAQTVMWLASACLRKCSKCSRQTTSGLRTRLSRSRTCGIASNWARRWMSAKVRASSGAAPKNSSPSRSNSSIPSVAGSDGNLSRTTSFSSTTSSVTFSFAARGTNSRMDSATPIRMA